MKPQPLPTPGAGLRARAIGAYNDACVRLSADEEQRRIDEEIRDKLLLQELVKCCFQEDVSLRQITMTNDGPRITLDGLEFGIRREIDYGGPDRLMLYRACATRGCTIHHKTCDAVESLRDVGRALAEPWYCGNCQSRRERREKGQVAS